MKIRCRYCGAENSSRARVCIECGRRLPVRRRNRFQRLAGITAAFFKEKPVRLFVPAAIIALALVFVFAFPKGQRETPASPVPGSTASPQATKEPIRLSAAHLDITIGDVGELTADNPSSPLTFSSSDEQIAIVSQDGAVKGIALGNATITVTNAQGGMALCSISVVEPFTLTGFALPERHARTYGCRLEGNLLSRSPLRSVRIAIYPLNGETEAAVPEVTAEVTWEDGEGALEYDLNDPERNLNQLTSFKQLTLGRKRFRMTASNGTHTDYVLYTADFEVYEKIHPYASLLPAEEYPCLAPSEWGDWIQWEKNLHHNIDPVFMGRLAAFAKGQGKKLKINSGFRTREKQEELYNDYIRGRGNPANKPGTSWHEFGGAVDVAEWARDVKESVYKKYGLCKPVDREDWHIQPVETVRMTDKEAFYNAYSSAKYPKWSSDCYRKV